MKIRPSGAISKPDGSFSIPNLPPGSYTLAAWHETLGTQTLQVTVAAKESKSDANFTFKAAAPFVKKLIASAIANAKQKRPDVEAESLFISKAAVDKAPNAQLRRWRPRAQGRATQIQKGVSHIVIELDQR